MDISLQNAMSIVNEMKRTIHRDINIMDENGVIIASTNPARISTVHQGALELLEKGLDCLTVWEDDPRRGVQQGINLPIRSEGHIEGVIGITGKPQSVSIYGTVIQRLTEIMLQSLRQRRQLAQMDWARSMFLESWLFSADVDWTELAARGQLLGFATDDGQVALMHLRAADGADTLKEVQMQEILPLVRKNIRERDGHYCTFLRNQIIVLFRSTDRKSIIGMLRSCFQEVEAVLRMDMAVGISDTFRSPMELRRCYREADAAVRLAEQSAPGSRLQFYDRKSLDFLLNSIPFPMLQDLKQMVFASCTEEERREYQEMIRLLMQYDGKVQKCAEALYLHRNSFQHRLDRIRDKTGYDFRRPKDLFLLYLASMQQDAEPSFDSVD